MYKLLLAAIICCLCGYIAAQCSVTSETLSRWSSLYGNQNGAITIASGQRVLLDVDVDVASIVIQAGGALYFDWTRDRTLTTGYILNSGSFIIGSESCPYAYTAIINLKDSNSAYRKAITGDGLFSIHGAKGLKKSWTKLSQTAVQGSRIIEVVDEVFTNDATGWKVGDEIVLATTDYSPNLNDRARISRIISTRSVELDRALSWEHFGQIANGVDMRGEVGLLTRSIRVIGVSDGQPLGRSLGAVIRWTAGPNLVVKVEGLEIVNGGQDVIGQYPLHFHMAGAMRSGTYLRDNSIHDSNFRCITIHGTHNVLVEGNVAFNSFGHCFFIEDGVEQNNTFAYNLAILTRAKNWGQRLGSDSMALSSYWITNTMNSFIGNVAVGCEDTGFWIQARQQPTGPSYTSGLYNGYRPVNAPLKLFLNNVAHSSMHGLQADGHGGDPFDNPPVINVANANPPNNPGGWSPSIPPVIDGYTAYKIVWRGLWMRTYDLTIINSKFAGCYEGMQLAAEGTHPPPSVQRVEDSLFVGITDNKGNRHEDQYQFWLDSTFGTYPKGEGGWMPMVGLKLYDGPMVFKRNTFRNYYGVRAGGGPITMLGARYVNPFIMVATNAMVDTRLDNVQTTMFVIDRAADGGKTYNMRDQDGTITGKVMSTMLVNWPYYQAPTCLTQTTPSVPLLCPQRYVNLAVIDWTTQGPQTNGLTITRTQFVNQNPNDMSIRLNGLNGVMGSWRWQPLISPGSAYLINIDRASPSLLFELNNAEIGDATTLAVCYPRGSSVQSIQRGNTLMGYITPQDVNRAMTSASSRQTITDNNYYYDADRAILFFKITQRYERTQYGNFCPSVSGCDFVWARMNIPQGAAARTDCISSAFSGDSIQDSSAEWLNQRFVDAPPRTPSTPVAEHTPIGFTQPPFTISEPQSEPQSHFEPEAQTVPQSTPVKSNPQSPKPRSPVTQQEYNSAQSSTASSLSSYSLLFIFSTVLALYL